MRPTTVATAVRIHIRVAHAISVGIYLVTAIGLVGIVASVMFQFAFPVTSMASTTVDSTNSATLMWTAPGDDGTSGTATSYAIRYSTSPINDSNWGTATAVSSPPAPLVAGSVQTMVVTGLMPGTTYYFAITSTDDVGNVSALSNIASKTTDTRACTPTWSCTEWSTCMGGVTVRSCVDIASPSCGTDFNRPIEQQSCTSVGTPAPTCTETWSCSSWTPCTQGLQTRTCQDLSRCSTTTDQPPVSYDCSMGGMPPADPNPRYLAVTRAAGGSSQIKVYRLTDGKLVTSFSPYSSKFHNGVSIAGGDLERKGVPNIVVGAGVGAAPQVSLYTVSGKLVTRFFAFSKTLRTGVTVATGDVNGDGYADLITTPAMNYPGLVRTYTYDPTTKKFSRFQDVSVQSSKYRGGVNIAAADLDRDGYAEIIVAPASKGRKSAVELYAYEPSKKKMVKKYSFSAYSRSFNSGIRVATGDVNGDGIPEIVLGPAPGTGEIRAFVYQNRSVKKIVGFYPASKTYAGGIDLTSADVNTDGNDDIISGTFSNGLPGVRAYSRSQLTKKISRLKVLWPNNIFSTSFKKGIRITAL